MDAIRSFSRIGGLLVASCGVFGGANAAESVYTTLSDEDCAVEVALEGSGATLYCPGYRGFGVLLQEDDLRQSVFYGHLGEWFSSGSFESFSQFNRIGETIEWRLGDDGLPFATIARWFIENVDPATGSVEAAIEGEVLVVSRVGQPGDPIACVVGYVDALSVGDANVRARQLADQAARDFACGHSEPIYAGRRGRLSGDPMISHGFVDEQTIPVE